MATTKEKVLLVGLPRSGTTVVANYINSMERAFCFLEPHWESRGYGSTSFFNDPKLRWIFRLKFQEDAPLPLDAAVRRIQRRYDLVGIKETFRGVHYSAYDPDMPNEELLADYVAAGYRLIPILRHPLAVWNSFRRYFPPQEAWAADLPSFIENYQRFYHFAGGTDAVLYERFVQDPRAEMARSGIWSEELSGGLTGRRARMGDPTAKSSGEVASIERRVYYTDAQKDVIEASSIVEAYSASAGR